MSKSSSTSSTALTVPGTQNTQIEPVTYAMMPTGNLQQQPTFSTTDPGNTLGFSTDSGRFAGDPRSLRREVAFRNNLLSQEELTGNYPDITATDIMSAHTARESKFPDPTTPNATHSLDLGQVQAIQSLGGEQTTAPSYVPGQYDWAVSSGLTSLSTQPSSDADGNQPLQRSDSTGDAIEGINSFGFLDPLPALGRMDSMNLSDPAMNLSELALGRMDSRNLSEPAMNLSELALGRMDSRNLSEPTLGDPLGRLNSLDFSTSAAETPGMVSALDALDLSNLYLSTDQGGRRRKKRTRRRKKRTRKTKSRKKRRKKSRKKGTKRKKRKKSRRKR